MLSLSSLIEFLLDMLRDENAQADFARDPNAALAARGLGDVTAQDVRDVQPLLADATGVHPAADATGAHAVRLHGWHGGSGWHPTAHGSEPAHHDPVVVHDVVREIHQVTHEYAVARPVTHVTQEYRTYNSYTEFTDHSVHASDGSTVIQDSFNQDNDGVDNKGGHIDDSTVAGHDMGQSGNDVATTTVDGSGNDSHAVTETGSENTVVDPDGHHVDAGEHGDPDDVHHGIAVDEPDGSSYAGHDDPVHSSDVNGSYVDSAHAADVPSDAPEPTGAEHVA